MSAARRTWTLVAVALATFMTYLDNNVLNVALPVIQRDLNLSVSGLEWIVSAYILVFASLLLAGGRLADVNGRRRWFLIGLTIFTGASLVAGLAGNVEILIAARAVQGLGAALVTPTTLAIVAAIYPDGRERAAAIGTVGAVGALALAFGPLIGGLLSQHASWGWIFFLNVPVGIVTFALARWSMQESRATATGATSRSMDLPGVALSSLSLFALTYALIEGHNLGWTSAPILALFAIATALGASFVRVEATATDPMINLRLFRDPVFSGGLTALLIFAFGLFGIYFFTSIYLQTVLGFSPTKAGAAFIPMALLMAVGAAVSEKVAHAIGAHRSVGISMLVMGLGIASITLLGRDSSVLALMPGFAIIGIGGGLNMSLTASVIDAMPAEEAGVASAMFNATREVAGLFGITVLGAILTARQSSLMTTGHDPVDSFLSGYRVALLVAAALVAAGGVAAFISLRSLHTDKAQHDRPAETGEPQAELVFA